MDPRLSLWLSVDPLAEKYPGVGSYVYCYNNPVRFVDPDGRVVYGKDGEPVQMKEGLLQHDARINGFRPTGQRTFVDDYWDANIFSSNATDEQKNMVEAASRSTELYSQLLDAVNSPFEVAFDYNTEDVVNDHSGYPIAGDHKGRLKHKQSIGYYVEKTTITLYDKTIDFAIGASSGNNKYKGLNKNDAIGVFLGHELGHRTKSGLKAAATLPKGSPERENPAVEVENKVMDQLKQKRK
jgi:hypothetical protein